MSKSPGAFNRSRIIWLLVSTLSVTGNGPPSFDAAESLFSKQTPIMGSVSKIMCKE